MTTSIDRLSAQDLAMVWPDDFGWPQDIGALAILEDAPLRTPGGDLAVDRVREDVAQKLHCVPRLRQLLVRPGIGRGGPYWADAPSVDLAAHVEVVAADAPGDEEALLRTVESLRRRPWNASRPLWRLWLIDGLGGGRAGLYVRLHHAIADGVAGVATLGALLDPEPHPRPLPPSPSAPRPSHSTWALVCDAARRSLRAIGRLLWPVRALRKLRDGWPTLREIFGEGNAPRTSLQGRVGSGRRLALLRASLADVKAVAHAHDAKVNDVLLAVFAAGLRALLAARGELVDDLVLRVTVPVSLHRQAPGGAQGNLDGMMAVPLPLGPMDDAARSSLIAAETRRRKQQPRPAGGDLFGRRVVQRVFLRLAARQRFFNCYAANVPGPPFPLYLAGARVLEVHPIVPLLGNITVGLGALSYCGALAITIVADADACPDVAVLRAAMQASLDRLTAPLPRRAAV